MRTTLRANEALRARDRLLAFANTVLTAATEGSLDAILIVDANAHIVSYNQHFVDLWQIPHELVAARIDAPVLEVVTSRTKDPAAFMARVKYLYDHPGEEGQGEDRNQGWTYHRPLFDDRCMARTTIIWAASGSSVTSRSRKGRRRR